MPKLNWQQAKQVKNTPGSRYDASFGSFAVNMFYDSQPQGEGKPPKEFWMLYCPPLLSGVPLESPCAENGDYLGFINTLAAVQELAEKNIMDAASAMITKLQDAMATCNM